MLQAKVTDLKGRSRRNNISIYGIKEDAEGNSMQAFITDFLNTELALSGDIDLETQSVHRSTVPKYSDNDPLRSILVNFQHYTTKDCVLKAAWLNKITRRQSCELHT